MEMNCDNNPLKEFTKGSSNFNMKHPVDISDLSDKFNLNHSCCTNTDIFNFEAYAKKMLDDNPNSNSHIMIVFGIDNFKEINNSYGSVIGSALLSYVQILLNSYIDEPNLYCQLHSDCFAIFLENCNDIDIALLTIQLTEEISNYDIECKPKLSFGICKARLSDSNVSSLWGRALYARRSINTDAGQLMADYYEVAAHV